MKNILFALLLPFILLSAKPLYIEEVVSNGYYVVLSDHSVWEIKSTDTIYTAEWISPVQVKIQRSNDPYYPYSLTNTVSGTTVLAKRFSMKELRKLTEKAEKRKRSIPEPESEIPEKIPTY